MFFVPRAIWFVKMSDRYPLEKIGECGLYPVRGGLGEVGGMKMSAPGFCRQSLWWMCLFPLWPFFQTNSFSGGCSNVKTFQIKLNKYWFQVAWLARCKALDNNFWRFKIIFYSLLFIITRISRYFVFGWNGKEGGYTGLKKGRSDLPW